MRKDFYPSSIGVREEASAPRTSPCGPLSIGRLTALRILATRFRGRGMPTTRYDVWMPSLAPTERTLSVSYD